MPLRSAPAQKARPVPVRMPAEIAGSSSIHLKTASSSMWPSMLMQFRSLGRLSVTRRMFGAGYERMLYFIFGGCVSKDGFQSIGAITMVFGDIIYDAFISTAVEV